MVRRAERRDETVVGPLREQGLIGPEIEIRRIPVSTVDVEAEREPRTGGKTAEGVAENRSDGPGPDVSLAKAAPLIDEIDVVVPAMPVPQRRAPFVCRVSLAVP